jgi:TRAP transporter TAXI family solute receptor
MMNRNWQKFIPASLLALVMALGLAECTSAADNSPAPTPHKTVYLTVCTPPSTSGNYPLYAAVPDAVKSDYPWYSISTIEGSGGAVNAIRVRNNEAQMGGSASAIDYQSYYGTDVFAGQPSADTRTLFYRSVSPLLICVSRNSGIKTFADMAGKRFCPGMTGGSTVPWMDDLAKVNGITVNWMPASMGDAIDAYSDRGIVGVAKSGSGNYDSTVIQLNAALAVDVISLTDEEIEAMCRLYPYVTPYTIPANTYDWIDHEVKTISTWACAISTAQLSQEDGYHIVKSLCEGNGRAIRDAASPGESKEDYPVNTLNCNIPVHAGMVQYMVERGLTVPPGLIPPEYVPVK